MRRTITTVLSAGEVAAILADHMIAKKELSLVPDSRIEAEMLACFEKDATGTVGIVQYRIEVTVEEAKESWRG